MLMRMSVNNTKMWLMLLLSMKVKNVLLTKITSKTKTIIGEFLSPKGIAILIKNMVKDLPTKENRQKMLKGLRSPGFKTKLIPSNCSYILWTGIDI
jgi:hypothetical protein